MLKERWGYSSEVEHTPFNQALQIMGISIKAEHCSDKAKTEERYLDPQPYALLAQLIRAPLL